MTIEIPLSGSNGVGQVALVDAEDIDLVRPWGWRLQLCNSGNTYARARIKGIILMHHLIIDAAMIDHINGNGLDNRRSNLRPATREQNGRNKRKCRAITTSGFKGVHLIPSGRWRARIRGHGLSLHLGVFANEREAARAYDAAAREIYGEYAAVNFPVEGERACSRRAGS